MVSLGFKETGAPKVVLFLAGGPATGKSYWAGKITERYPFFQVLALDEQKERFFDSCGFANKQEKEQVIQKALAAFYSEVERSLQNGKALILEYPFSDKQRETLETLLRKYEYRAITITFISDLSVLYERQRKRDLEDSRHLGHIMTHYHAGDQLEDKSKADDLVTFEVFLQRCLERGYADFQIGSGIKIDVTDFDKTDEQLIMDWLAQQLIHVK